MKKLQLVSIAMMLTVVVPMAAFAQQRMSEEQLIERANTNRICGERTAIAARYVDDTSNRVSVTCGDDAEGFVPLVGAGLGGIGAGAAAAGALGLAALAAGGGGSTSDTQ